VRPALDARDLRGEVLAVERDADGAPGRVPGEEGLGGPLLEDRAAELGLHHVVVVGLLFLFFLFSPSSSSFSGLILLLFVVVIAAGPHEVLLVVALLRLPGPAGSGRRSGRRAAALGRALRLEVL